MNAYKFRRHASGLSGSIRFVNLFLLIGLVGQAIMALASTVSMISDDISITVVATKLATASAVSPEIVLSMPKVGGLMTFEARNILEWLFLPRHEDFYLYTTLISLAVTWQLYLIFKGIQVEQPFRSGILVRLVNLRQLILLGIIFSVLRYIYVMFIVQDLGQGKYTLATSSYLSSTGYFTIGTWVLVYFFIHVYERGAVLQHESDLTI